MSPNQPEIPDFEAMLSDALGIRFTRVAQKVVNFKIDLKHPDQRIVRRTLVVSTIEKTGKISNLPTGGAR